MSKLDEKITRRTVIKIGSLTLAAIVVGVPKSVLTGSLKAETGKTVLGKSKQLGFMYDQVKCIGCKQCAKACKETNHWEEGAEWRKVYAWEPGAELHKEYAWEPARDKVYLSMSCNHCADPACMKGCPVKAYTKRDKDGIVIHDPNRCVGCGYCLNMCPYHAPQFIKTGTGAVMKCNFCAEIQDQGGKPACVTACPTGALTYGDITKLRKATGAVAPEVNGLPSVRITDPSLVIIPKA